MSKLEHRNLLEIWAARYPFEESIASETEILQSLTGRQQNIDAVDLQMAKLVEVLDALPPHLSAPYEPWCRDRSNYAFASDAFYQRRIFWVLLKLSGTPFEVVSDEPIIARKLVAPSQVEGTPRIVRFRQGSVLIFPVPTMFWMYVVFELVAEHMLGLTPRMALIDTYVRYLAVTHAYFGLAQDGQCPDLDFVMEELAHAGGWTDVPDADRTIETYALGLIDITEIFVVCHELAHRVLDHNLRPSPSDEKAADSHAFEMMRQIKRGSPSFLEEYGIPDESVPVLAPLAVAIWKIVRRATSRVALGYAGAIASEHDRVNQLLNDSFDDLRKLVTELDAEATGLTRGVVYSWIQGLNGLLDSVAAVRPDVTRMERAVRLARGLAGQDLAALREIGRTEG